jgi:hypothetical protein
MFTHKDGKVFIQLPADAEDAIMVALLESGKALVQSSLKDTLAKVAAYTSLGSEILPHHQIDLQDDLKHLNAFNVILEYYGVR